MRESVRLSLIVSISNYKQISMNNRRLFGCIAGCFLLTGATTAQPLTLTGSEINPRQVLLFNGLPQKISCNTESLGKLFSSSDKIVLSLSPIYEFKGEIISRSHPNASAETMNISLYDFPQSLFTISRILQEDGSIQYTAHIFSFRSQDALILSREEGKYFFIKTEQRLLLTE